jgi:putative flippase GtrA
MNQIPTYINALFCNMRFGKFISVGFIGLLVDMSLLTLLVEIGDFTPTLGKICSTEISIVSMFVINDFWTFKNSGGKDIKKLSQRFIRSNIVRWGGGGVGLFILHILTTTFSIYYLLANMIGIGIGVIFNYVFESLITWKIHKRDTNG